MSEYQSTLIHLTANITAAYLKNNGVLFDQIPDLIRNIFRAMTRLGSLPEVEEVQMSPAVSIKKSVADDSLTCLCCGRKFSMLKRHIRTDHDMTVNDYRIHWKLPGDVPPSVEICLAGVAV